MAEFKVTWEIDIEAETPYEAALEALKIQRDSGSIATFFSVIDLESSIERFIDIEVFPNLEYVENEH